MDAENTFRDAAPLVRDVWLESTLTPVVNDPETGLVVEGEWRADLFNLAMACADVADLIRFCDAAGVPVVFDPPGNMTGFLNPKRRPGQGLLFDVG
jgi:hypothetical protein